MLYFPFLTKAVKRVRTRAVKAAGVLSSRAPSSATAAQRSAVSLTWSEAEAAGFMTPVSGNK